MEEIEQNRPPKQVLQSCRECQAEFAFGAGPCVTPLMRCFRSSECSRSLEMLNENAGNSIEPEANGFDSTRQTIDAVLRCVCHTGCRKACGGICR